MDTNFVEISKVATNTRSSPFCRLSIRSEYGRLYLPDSLIDELGKDTEAIKIKIRAADGAMAIQKNGPWRLTVPKVGRGFVMISKKYLGAFRTPGNAKNVEYTYRKDEDEDGWFLLEPIGKA